MEYVELAYIWSITASTSTEISVPLVNSDFHYKNREGVYTDCGSSGGNGDKCLTFTLKGRILDTQ